MGRSVAAADAKSKLTHQDSTVSQVGGVPRPSLFPQRRLCLFKTPLGRRRPFAHAARCLSSAERRVVRL